MCAHTGFHFSINRKLSFSGFIAGVSYLPYLSPHGAPCGLHAAESQCPVLLHGWWAPTGISHSEVSASFLFLFRNISHVFFSGGNVWCDAFLFLLQELINRHLITMAQIDHSENPGKGSTLLSQQSVVINPINFLVCAAERGRPAIKTFYNPWKMWSVSNKKTFGCSFDCWFASKQSCISCLNKCVAYCEVDFFCLSVAVCWNIC